MREGKEGDQKHDEGRGNHKMRNGGPNLQPAPRIPDQIEEVQGHHIGNGKDQEKEGERRQVQEASEDPKNR